MSKQIEKGKFITSKKFGYAVQLYHTQKGDTVYYACYHDTRDLDSKGIPKRKRLKIGTKKGGITEQYVKAERDKIMVALRDDKTPTILQAKKEIYTFGQVADQYFTHRSIERLNPDDKNIKNDKSIFKNHLSIFVKYKIDSFSSMDIETFKLAKLTEREPKTINNILTLLIAIFNFGVDKGFVKEYPKIKKLTGIDNQRDRYFSQDEINQILNHIKDNIILTIFVKISLSTGGRLETVRNIKVKDINFNDTTISLVDLKGKSAGKNNATYTGFFKESMKDELQQFITGLSPNSYIFRYPDGRRVSKDYIQNNLQKLFNKLFNQGLESNDSKNRAVVHTLRHTFATQLAKNGESIFNIQKLLNHSDIKMTLRYAKFSPENGRNAINNLNLF
ncbi:MAG: site-specific integrase [Burkholderiales bacterium]|nr:site-specific integrase [Burkholderiales bacterium]